MQTELEFRYYFDPLCGWCYASAPALAALAGQQGGRLRMMPTGLFVQPRPMAAMAAHAWSNDRRIMELTGQPFSEVYHQRVLLAEDGVFGSRALTLCLIALGLIDPRLEPRFLHEAQRARYVEGRDSARPGIAAEIAAEVAGAAGHAVTAAALADRLERDKDLQRHAQARMDASRADMAALGLRGVPQLVIHQGEARRIVESGLLYGGAEALSGLVAGITQGA